MLRQLALKHSQDGWSFGVLLSEQTLCPRDRIRINGETVEKSLFERCVRECQKDIKKDEGSDTAAATNANTNANDTTRLLTSKERLDIILVKVALHIFKDRKVATVAVAINNPPPKTHTNPSASTQAKVAAGKQDSVDGKHEAFPSSTERLVMDIYRPKTVVCGFEPLSSFSECLPESWSRQLDHLSRQPVQLISSVQPKPVRMELHSLAKSFGTTIELAQPLSTLPTTRDTQLGIYGPEQQHFASLALAVCQAWAFQNGLLRQRAQNHGAGEYSVAMALNPMRQPQKHTVPQSPFQSLHQSPGLRDTPAWMLRGLSSARCQGHFYTVLADTKAQANWFYNWAETPHDFERTGEWFNSTPEQSPENPKILLIHLPKSFISTVFCQRYTDGQDIMYDYREMLWSLYMSLRHVKWACCVFAADILHESNVLESNVPPVLSQYVLRDYWSQISGMQTESIYIAPSLASALRLISSTCASQVNSLASKTVPISELGSKTLSPATANSSRSTLFEAPLTPRPPQLLQPSSSTTNILTLTNRPSRALSRTTGLKNATSVDNLREGRRKFSLGISISGSESAVNLPLRTPRTAVPPTATATTVAATAGQHPGSPKVDILVTGAKSFVQSTILVTQRQMQTYA
ncbi:hypothetical protein GGI07_000687 [Coemansia sp. Benny D115]|nr:hypothetical protein GGI07_000687 [Coemansia sp. Benny D115]